MFDVKVYGYENNVYVECKFRSFEKLSDFGAKLAGNDEQAKEMHIYKGGAEVGFVDFDVLRDKALAEGHTLPIHEKMVANA